MRPARVDSLQYCNWNRERFLEMRAGGLDAVHATICYHENFRETTQNISRWNDFFNAHADLILRGDTAADIRAAQESKRTAIFFRIPKLFPDRRRHSAGGQLKNFSQFWEIFM